VTRENGENAVLSVVFVIKGSMGAESMVTCGNKAAWVWYRVETYTNEGPDSRCELSCPGGHIKKMCGTKSRCSYSSGHQQTSDHKCIVVGCTAKQASLCGHTLEKCYN
jgi:hypothetical protein